MSEKMEHSNTNVSSGKFGQIWVFTFYTHLHTYIPFVKVGMGFCPIWGIWRGAGTPATSQMRCWRLRRHKLHIPRPAASGRSRPFRCASSQNRNRVAGLRFCFFTRWRNVGFSRCAAHTLAVGAESRTQRRHAPHGAAQARCSPTGSIGSIFPTAGRSALSALRSEISRFPLLR